MTALSSGHGARMGMRMEEHRNWMVTPGRASSASHQTLLSGSVAGAIASLHRPEPSQATWTEPRHGPGERLRRYGRPCPGQVRARAATSHECYSEAESPTYRLA